jgi:hypothetical protein
VEIAVVPTVVAMLAVYLLARRPVRRCDDEE